MTKNVNVLTCGTERVKKYYDQEIEEARELSRQGGALRIVRIGQYDLPGKTAMYCTLYFEGLVFIDVNRGV